MSSHVFRWVRGRRCGADDAGSLMFALFGVLVVTIAMVATLAMVAANQRTTRKDQRFSAAGQGADAGVQEAYLAIRSLPTSSTSTSLSGNTTINGTPYTWTATRSSATSLAWTVSSAATKVGTGPEQSTLRTVKAVVDQQPLFALAVFGDTIVDFHGSATSTPAAGKGIVGTNGNTSIKPKGTVDGFTFYDTAVKGTATRCSGGPTSGCPGTVTTVSSHLDLSQSVSDDGFITAQLDVCKAAGALPPFSGQTIVARDEPYCFSSFTALSKGTPFTVTGPADKAARIFVSGGDVTLGTGTGNGSNQASVNMTPGADGRPEPWRLQIYSDGATVNPTNHGNVAAVVYAPNANCQGDPGDSQSTFTGSIYCGTITYQNPTVFTYDTRLNIIGDGNWELGQYAEPGS